MAKRSKASNLSPQAKTKAFTDELDKIYGDDLHKELWFHSGKQPEDTLYRWWWEFIKASEGIPNNTAEQQVGAASAETVAAFGELGSNFLEWWDRRGSALFQENKVPKIVPLVHDNMTDDYIVKNGLPIFLPLGVSRKLIHSQIDLLLDHFHANQKFKRHDSSTAKLRIFAKNRHREIDYEVLRDIWVERQQDLKAGHDRPLWEIFCLATKREGRIAELRLLNRNTEDERNEYGKRCSELLKVSEDIMRNALRGIFPKDTAARATKSSKKTKKAGSHT